MIISEFDPLKYKEDAVRLAKEHYRSVGSIYEGKLKIEIVDYCRYIGIFTDDDKLVGYTVLSKGCIHYLQDTHFEVIIAMFIDEKYRSYTMFKTLMEFIEQSSREYGFKYIMMSLEFNAFHLDKLFKRLKYKLSDITYTKKL